MAKISMNIPKYNLTSFLNNCKRRRKAPPGVETPAMAKPVVTGLNMRNIKKHISPFVLFDWEFFSNELEFE